MQIKADDNIVVCLPVAMELQRTGSIYHRVPIRCTEKQCGTAAVEMVAGAGNIAKEAKGLKRLLLRFPPVFCPGVKQYQSNEQDRQQQQNMSLPFALFDARKPEKSEEDNKLCTQVDAVADFIRKLVVGNQNIRRTLNLGRSGEMTQQEVQMAADMLHGSIFLSRPVEEGRARYCYPKLVPPTTSTPTVYHTVFFKPDSSIISFDEVVAWNRGFTIEPCIEMEELFVSKTVKSLQLRVRECIVYPPETQGYTRYSVVFPDVALNPESNKRQMDAQEDDVPNKQQRVSYPNSPQIQTQTGAELDETF